MSLLGVFIVYPWAAVAVAAVFSVLCARSKRVLSGLAAVAWLLYAVYEYGMKLRWLCTGECNIRVDLLLIYPILLLLSISAAISARNGVASRSARRSRR